VPDILFVPTPQNIVDKMLDVARVSSKDLVYDLGCGDGRILVTAASRFGARGVGFDIDPDRVAESRANVLAAGVQNLVTIEQKNVFEVDLSPATVVALYLLPNLNVRLIPQLEKLGQGARVVSHDFDIDGVTPTGQWKIIAPMPSEPDKLRNHTVFLWQAPIRRSKGY
jgi:ribosomal protein L11 methylase PrmA